MRTVFLECVAARSSFFLRLALSGGLSEHQCEQRLRHEEGALARALGAGALVFLDFVLLALALLRDVQREQVLFARSRCPVLDLIHAIQGCASSTQE